MKQEEFNQENRQYWKCPHCKSKALFLKFDVNCVKGYGYIKGDYAILYRCELCHVIIAKKRNELQ